MRITESRLRKIIRSVISEIYMTDDGIQTSSYSEAEAEVLRIVQDKNLVSDSLNRACDDISSGNKGVPENVIRRKIAEHAMRYLMAGRKEKHNHRGKTIRSRRTQRHVHLFMATTRALV